MSAPRNNLQDQLKLLNASSKSSRAGGPPTPASQVKTNGGFQLAKLPGITSKSFSLPTPGPSKPTPTRVATQSTTTESRSRPKSAIHVIHPSQASLRNSVAPVRTASASSFNPMNDESVVVAIESGGTVPERQPPMARGRKRQSEDHEDGATRAQRFQAPAENSATTAHMRPPSMSSGRESQTRVTQLTRDVLMANADESESRRGSGTVMSGAGSGSNKLQNMPIEKLQAMLAHNKDEQIRVLQKLLDDDDDVDREMIQMQSSMLSKRNKELIEIINNRVQSSSMGSSSPSLASKQLKLDRPAIPPEARISQWAAGLQNTDAGSEREETSSPTHHIAANQNEIRSAPSQRRNLPTMTPSRMPSNEELNRDQGTGPSQASSRVIASGTPNRVAAKAQPAAAQPIDVDFYDDYDMEAIIAMEAEEAQIAADEEAARRLQAELDVQPQPEPSRLSAVANMSNDRGRNRTPVPSNANVIEFEDEPVSARVQQRPRAASPKRIHAPQRWTKEVNQKLETVFKLPGFRHNQREAIDAVLSGKDVFILMPTGGGKSLCYQLPAICDGGETRGVTFVVSPLLSLITDQCSHLASQGIPAIAYTGDLSAADKKIANHELTRDEPIVKIVYITPEMLKISGVAQGILQGLHKRNRLARFVIDEAHCLSSWGHDFRPDYRALGELKTLYPGVPLMALTATANNQVQEDVRNILNLRGCAFFKQSFNRPNLYYEVRPKIGKDVVAEMYSYIQMQPVGSTGIIYANSRDNCENLAAELRTKHGVRAHHYHAGLPKEDRIRVQTDWQANKFEVIVATTAFGMGIDKADVRYVIHHAIPRSLEGYYQETGRAGRDGKASQCVVFYRYSDVRNVLSQIERDPDLNREQKQRNKNAVQAVLRYCDNKTDCRRAQVLGFFGEGSCECYKGCDVCLTLENDPRITRDVTEDVVNAIKLVQQIDDRITMKAATGLFRGTKSAKGGDNPFFGVGSGWSIGDAERLFEKMTIENLFGEKHVRNGAGFSTSYICLGDGYRPYLEGKKRFKMDFRTETPRAAKTKAKSKAAQTKAATAKKQGAILRNPSTEDVFAPQEYWASDDEEIFDAIQEVPSVTKTITTAKRVTPKGTLTLGKAPNKGPSVGLGPTDTNANRIPSVEYIRSFKATTSTGSSPIGTLRQTSLMPTKSGSARPVITTAKRVIPKF